MSRTVIPSGGNVKQPGKNQTYVNSRQGSAVENKMTSAKVQNPEYFKKQSDRKNSDAIYGTATPESRAKAHALARQPNPELIRKRKEMEYENRALEREHSGKGNAYSRSSNPYSK